MIRLLQNMGASLVRRESNTLEYEVALAPSEEHGHSWDVLLSRSSAP
jgi:hypothetical protein